MEKHPGLLDDIVQFLREHPNNEYSPADLAKAFPRVKISKLQSYLNEGREKGFLFSEKRGFYKIRTADGCAHRPRW